jgi:hypothetical protein
MNIIRLIPQGGANGVWLADYSGNHDLDTILRVFGTHIVPTPFRSVTPFWKVSESLRSIDPTRIITHTEIK